MSNIKKYLGIFLLCLAVAVPFKLGLWQVERLAWKRDLLTDIADRQTLAEIPFSELMAKSLPEDQLMWRKVSLKTRPIKAPMLQLMSRTYEGEAGFHILGLVTTELGPLWVNWGWRPFTETEKWQNSILEDQALELSLLLRPLPKRGAFTPENNSEKRQYFSLEHGEQPRLYSDFDFMGQVVSPAAFFGDEAPKLVQISPDLPNNHRQYAVFWFTASFIIFCILLFYLYKVFTPFRLKRSDRMNKE